MSKCSRVHIFTCPGDRHVSEIASMALDLLAGSVVFQIPHRPNARLNIRMGIHRCGKNISTTAKIFDRVR